ncbi:phytoene desaturase family protein [Lentzea sp. DG1S-22]|uniref:phytoene desaturase family protein n=1 Tax=Lentzea sp. DG1S-22 TaxID=3108822 RepID=UPI002E760A8B|nr:phytoene desaturase family protein [Lentzea sp. DG1S-22]WVH83246.1 phytoene desaturase family protein [Lentzea sp. DG1S-22]
MARVAVIGAGMGGLAAAARLATSGHEVTVFEQAASHGGKLGTVRRDGFTFDTGPSLLTLPHVYRDLFAATGAPLDDVVEIVPVEPTCRYRFPDGSELDMPHAEEDVEAALSDAIGPEAARQWRAVLADADRLWDLVGEPVLQNPLGGVRDLVRRSASVRDLMAIAPWRTMRGVGERRLTDPRLRMLLDRYATYSGSDPRRTPALMTVVPFIEQRFGGWYVRGGLRRLGDALFDRCAELGVRFRFGAAVTAVESGSGGVTGVRLRDGERHAADVVVSDVDAEHLYGELLTDRRSRRPRRTLRKTQPSLSGFVLLLALRGRTPDPAHHRVLFPADYDDEFDSIFGRHPRPVPDPTVYVCAPDDPAIAPPGDEAWFVLVNAPRQGDVDWTAPGLADSYADRVLAVMADRGLDVRDRVRWREIRTPADWARDTGSVGGSIYGSSSNGPRAALLRPANRSPVPGLFLVGGSAHPGGGLPLVAMSAGIVAGLVGPA